MNGPDVNLIRHLVWQTTGISLDQADGEHIYTELERHGWASRETLAAIIASAGGRIDVQQRHLEHPPTTMGASESTAADVAYVLTTHNFDRSNSAE